MSKSKGYPILDEIFRKIYQEEIMQVVNSQPEEIKIAESNLTADEWQEFKRKFVEEYGEEPVQPTGMTHSEFLKYIKTSGERENSEFRNFEDILREMDDDD